MESSNPGAQLRTAEQSVLFLVLLIFSLLLSLWAAVRQRDQLAAGETPTQVFPVRMGASALVVGSLGFFLCLSLRTARAAAQGEDPAARRSADRNLAAALLVFAAALLRLWDLTDAGTAPTK